MFRALLPWALLLSACSASPRPSPLPSPREEPVAVHGLANIQRTMRLLARSTPGQGEPVRLLFYGQSITQSSWSRKLEVVLRRRFPHAALQIENRALGGFASDLLVKTAETDLYPFYPDLVIFHVYGAHDRYEDIVRRLRERTTSELLLMSDHITRDSELHEQTDVSKLEPRAEQWSAFMNNAFLPSLVARYQAALCDQRAAWKQHLERSGEPPSAFLRDEVHPNARGDMLMASYVERCLRDAPAPAPAEAWVKTLAVGSDVSFDDGVLSLELEGNRVDALLAAGHGGSLSARIDGRPPSAWPELYTFARAHARTAGKWPPVFDVSSAAPLVRETFVLDVLRVGDVANAHYTFTLRGEQTGPDGEGRSDRRFESHSGRVILEPEDWNVAYAFALAEVAVPEHFSIELRVETHFADSFAALDTERVVTIAQGLPNTRHHLELRGDPAALRALRVYRPPLAAR
jgi:hypothetical protein